MEHGFLVPGIVTGVSGMAMAAEDDRFYLYYEKIKNGHSELTLNSLWLRWNSKTVHDWQTFLKKFLNWIKFML